jgi:lactate dehydrogenase-like 2-hydroxyacid dehydrogenase
MHLKDELCRNFSRKVRREENTWESRPRWDDDIKTEIKEKTVGGCGLDRIGTSADNMHCAENFEGICLLC